MPAPLPHQIAGATFLSSRKNALLADEPRVGKTGAAIMAADDILAMKVLVITTASGRPVWARGFREWSWLPRRVEVFYGGPFPAGHLDAGALILGWAALKKLPRTAHWDLIIVDESHYAKSVDTARTKALYGTFRGASRDWGLCDQADRVWCLTGTPIPNAPNDLYPMLRALAPDRIEGVERYSAFLDRYCIVKPKRISRWNTIDVVVGGRNLEELHDRLDGFMLRRTQADVGIRRPIYDILPIHITEKKRREVEAEVEDAEEILAAAETGETRTLELHMGTLRRLTGSIKAHGVVDAVKDEFQGGLDKVVIMAWHKGTLDILEDELTQFGAVRVDGSTSPTARDNAQQTFEKDPACRVFLGQIVACGEAIDLSAAAELIFAESSFVPKDMQQAALRITNHGQTRQPRVRVAALEGSIDEALQSVLIRKVATNKEVIK